mgnify:CR=1 FL=1
MVVVDPGDRIHFLDWGGHRRFGVLLVHGLSNTAWSWAPVARRLAEMRRTVAMDLRGHGLSDAPTEAYAAELLAEDVVAHLSVLAEEQGQSVVVNTHAAPHATADRQVVRQAHEARLVLHIHVLAAHIAVEVRAQFGMRQIVFTGLHNQPGAGDLT